MIRAEEGSDGQADRGEHQAGLDTASGAEARELHAGHSRHRHQQLGAGTPPGASVIGRSRRRAAQASGKKTTSCTTASLGN